MGLILCYCGFQCILIVFGHFAFYRFGQGSVYFVALVAFHVVGLILCYCGFQCIFVVFNLLTADVFGGGTVGFYFIGAVHALGEGNCLSCAAIGFAHNAVGEIFGDGEGFGTFSYSNLSFFCILADDGVLVLSVHCCVYHGEGAVVIADHSSGDVIAAWYCVITQVLGDYLRPYGGTSCGIYSPFIGSDGDRAAVFIENGFCSVFHSATDFMNFGCYLAFIDIGLVEVFASQGNVVGFQAAGNFQILGSDFPSGIDIVSIDIAGGCDGAAACIQISTFQCQAVSFHCTGYR